MLLARAFILGLNSRAILAVVIVAMSVAYALLISTAVGGLQIASQTIAPDLAQPQHLVALPGMRPFPLAQAPAGSTVLTHAAWHDGTLGTVRPWPYEAEAIPGPYARLPPDAGAQLGLPVGEAKAHVAPWDWVLVPPDAFDRLVPGLRGQGTVAFSPLPGAPEGFVALDAPAAGAFYREGAGQVYQSVHLVVAAMALTVAVLASGVLGLEVLARERDLATLEAIGGTRAARRAVVLRALWLVALGALVGTAAGWALARLAGRALGLGSRGLDLGFAAEVVVVAVVAGSVAGAAAGLAGLRTPLAARLGRRGPSPRPFRGPVRFLLVTPRVVPSALAAALVLVSITSVVLAAASVPALLFEPGEGIQVVGQSAGNPFRGSADRFFGERATLFEGINASSPETVAPTLVLGKPVVVRGVALDGWRAVDPVRLVEGRWPAAPDEATAGTRVARALGVRVGDEVLVPGAYRATLHVLRVTGLHEGAGFADDELVTDLDTAGDLAALSPAQVHMVRLRASPEAMRDAVEAEPVRATHLTVLPEHPIPHSEAIARVHLVNVAPSEGVRTLALRVNDVLVSSVVARVPGHREMNLDLRFRVPDAPFLEVRVNPTANVTTADPSLRVDAPETAVANATIAVRVSDRQGAPVAGALVAVEGVQATTDGAGVATLRVGVPGSVQIVARAGGLEGGRLVYVVERQWALIPHLEADQAVIESAVVQNTTHDIYDLVVTVTNLGGAPFNGTVEATLDGRQVGSTAVQVGVRQQLTIPLRAETPRGAASLTVAGLTVPLPAVSDVSAPAQQRPRTVADIIAAKQAEAERLRAARELSGAAFLKDVFANLTPSVVLVVLATVIHAGAGTAVAVLREVRERGEVLHTLRQLGASTEQLTTRCVRDALVATLPGLLAGAAIGLVALALLSPLGFPAAFGHTIPLQADAGFYLRVVGVLAIVACATAAWAARVPPEAPPMQAPPAPLRELLGAAP